MIHRRKQMVRDMIVESAKKEVSDLTFGPNIIGTSNLVFHPAASNSTLLYFWIITAFYMMRHDEGKGQKQRLNQMHG